MTDGWHESIPSHRNGVRLHYIWHGITLCGYNIRLGKQSRKGHKCLKCEKRRAELLNSYAWSQPNEVK